MKRKTLIVFIIFGQLLYINYYTFAQDKFWTSVEIKGAFNEYSLPNISSVRILIDERYSGYAQFTIITQDERGELFEILCLCNDKKTFSVIRRLGTKALLGENAPQVVIRGSLIHLEKKPHFAVEAKDILIVPDKLSIKEK